VLTSPDCEIHALARPGEDFVGALEALTTALSLGGSQMLTEKAERPARLPAKSPYLGLRLPWDRSCPKYHRSRRVYDFG